MPPASLAGLGEKLGTDPRIGQLACYALCREPFFLRSSGIYPNLSALRKRLPRTGTAAGSVRRAYVDWSGKHTCQVGGFSPAGCIDLNHHNSRI
jgi:hypothetical protein